MFLYSIIHFWILQCICNIVKFSMSFSKKECTLCGIKVSPPHPSAYMINLFKFTLFNLCVMFCLCMKKKGNFLHSSGLWLFHRIWFFQFCTFNFLQFWAAPSTSFWQFVKKLDFFFFWFIFSFLFYKYFNNNTNAILVINKK